MNTAAALSGDNPICKILKEGYLTTEKQPHTWHLKRTTKRAWCVLEQDHVTAFSTYKDDTKTTLKDTVKFVDVNKLEVDKHQDDTYLCIRYGKKILHLRAETKQHRDEWYVAIMRSLFRLQGAPAGDQAETVGYNVDSARVRSDSESTAMRPPVTTRGRRASPGIVQSSPGMFDALHKQLKEVLNSDSASANADCADDGVSKIRFPRCCVRNHVVVQDDKVSNDYINIHFIRSEDEHRIQAAQASEKLRQNANIYSDLHELSNIQSENEPIYEDHIGAVPVPAPDAATTNPPQNNLNPPNSPNDLAVGFSPNIAEDESTASACSSIEDNTEPIAKVNIERKERKAPPPVPSCTGHRLMNKTQQLKEDQKQLSITKTFDKSSLVGDKDKITLMEENDGLWVIGWDQRETQLRGALKAGDQLIKINSQTLTSAAFAMDIVRTTDDHKVQFVLKRIPHGCVCTIKRPSSRDDLGIQLEGNEIISVDPHGLASRRGDLRPQTTGVAGGMCNWAITEINAQAVDLFASSDEVMRLLRLAKEDVVLVVQPVDFIQSMRETLKGTQQCWTRTPSTHTHQHPISTTPRPHPNHAGTG